MLRYILHKLALIVPTVIGISLAAFAFVRLLPGDPILAMAGERGVSPERYAELREQFGFNRPIWQQYFNYVWQRPAGRFRHFARHQAPGHRRVPDAVSGDASNWRSSPC